MSDTTLDLSEDLQEPTLDTVVEDDVEEDTIPVPSGILSGVELEALLEKKDHRTFRQKLNVPDDFDEVDDLESMFVFSQTPNAGTLGAKTLYKNLFDVLCSLAGESLSNAPMTSVQQLLNYNLKFQHWLDNIHLTRSKAILDER